MEDIEEMTEELAEEIPATDVEILDETSDETGEDCHGALGGAILGAGATLVGVFALKKVKPMALKVRDWSEQKRLDRNAKLERKIAAREPDVVVEVPNNKKDKKG